MFRSHLPTVLFLTPAVLFGLACSESVPAYSGGADASDVSDALEDTVPDVPYWETLGGDANKPDPDITIPVPAENCEEDPTGFGCPCEDADDCASGWCIPGQVGNICTDPCLEQCPSGWKCLPLISAESGAIYVCTPEISELCAACEADADCGGEDDRCVEVGSTGLWCASACESNSDCPANFGCTDAVTHTGEEVSQCTPVTESCVCSSDLIGSSLPCANTNLAGVCYGEKFCLGADGWSICSAHDPTAELCDEVDNDCNGLTDEGLAGEPCEISVAAVGSCPGIQYCDEDGGVSCDADTPIAEECDGLDNDCDGEVDEGFPDPDGDGVKSCLDEDDDGDGIGDGIDNCPNDPNTDQKDADNDGVGDACVNDVDGDDKDDFEDNCDEVFNPDQADQDNDGAGDLCDDDIDGDGFNNDQECAPDNPDAAPGAPELCDGVDNNCDGDIDEENASGCVVYLHDKDGDGFGSGAESCQCSAPPNWVVDGGDCDDLNPSAHPGATEVCNGVDDDCLGGIDDNTDIGCTVYFQDADTDGFGSNGDSQCLCAPIGTYTAPIDGDCNDDNAAVHPEAVEICNGTDDDCTNGVDTENGLQGCTVYFQDIDDDGFGLAGTGACACESVGDQTATQAGDCDDQNPIRNPGQPEICDGFENNCNGQIDEVCDLDDDTYCSGEVGLGIDACPSGGGDCDDSNSLSSPGAPESCDTFDNDCDGLTDENVQAPCGGCVPWCSLLESGPFAGGPTVFTQIFTGWPQPLLTNWVQISATATTPVGSSLLLQYRSAASAAGLAGAAWSAPQGPFPPSIQPFNFEDVGGLSGAVIEIQITLQPAPNGALPSLQSIQALGVLAP